MTDFLPKNSSKTGDEIHEQKKKRMREMFLRVCPFPQCTRENEVIRRYFPVSTRYCPSKNSRNWTRFTGSDDENNSPLFALLCFTRWWEENLSGNIWPISWPFRSSPVHLIIRTSNCESDGLIPEKFYPSATVKNVLLAVWCIVFSFRTLVLLNRRKTVNESTRGLLIHPRTWSFKSQFGANRLLYLDATLHEISNPMSNFSVFTISFKCQN